MTRVIDLSNLSSSGQGFTLHGSNAVQAIGASVSCAGDVNGVGIADVIVGAPFGFGNANEAGEAYVIFGRDVAGGRLPSPRSTLVACRPPTASSSRAIRAGFTWAAASPRRAMSTVTGWPI